MSKDEINRSCPDPKYNLAEEMEKVFERGADLVDNDEKQSLVYIMDNKLVLLGRILTAAEKIETWSYESRALFMLGYTAAEHDAVVAAWREKVRHDLVRPTTVSQEMLEEREVTWYDGSKVSTKQWTPIIRVMPHAEYPSGSMAICQAIADFTRMWMQEMLGIEDLATTWMVAKGSTPEGLPKEDWMGTMETLEMLAETCGESRLWGGMHFTAAVPAGKDLVDGLGAHHYEYTKILRRSGDLPKVAFRCGETGKKITGKTGAIVGEMAVADACACMKTCKIAMGGAYWSFKKSRQNSPSAKRTCMCYSKGELVKGGADTTSGAVATGDA